MTGSAIIAVFCLPWVTGKRVDGCPCFHVAVGRVPMLSEALP